MTEFAHPICYGTVNMNVTLYGIPNCDTIKKCRHWLDEHQIAYHFHDYRKAGLSPSLLTTFIEQLGLDALINKRGTTYRALTQEQKSALESATTATPLLMTQPALIKRPLLCYDDNYLLGFDKERYATLFDVTP